MAKLKTMPRLEFEMTIGSSTADQVEVPELPVGAIELQAPPEQAEAQGPGNVLATLIPMMGSMGVMVFMAFSDTSNVRNLLMGGAMVVAMVAMLGFNVYRQVSGHRHKVDALRREYLAYLADTRKQVRDAARRQRAFTNWHLPDPRSLVLVAEEGSRIWEREPHDDGILDVRVGSGSQDLSVDLREPPFAANSNTDPVCLSAMNRFLNTHGEVDDMPLGVSIGEFSHLEIAGDLVMTRALLRGVVAHLATFVAPDQLRVAVLCSPQALPEWEWLKWLPQARSNEETDALGARRMVTTDYVELTQLLGSTVTSRAAFEGRSGFAVWPHVLLIVDDTTLPPATRLGSRDGTSGVTVVTLPTSWGALTSLTTLRMLVHPPAEDETRGRMEVVILDRDPVVAVPDAMSIEQAEAVARRMAKWTGGERPEADTPAGRADFKRSSDLMELLNLGDVRDFDPERQWVPRLGRDRLRVPFGVTPEGVPVALDIKESAQFGMGPHGLLIGATGSGKSEVLRTLVLALALTHSPEQLNFVLVDFKGGATFAGMSELPHVSAMISNLESELFLVDRMEDAIRGEMTRRQEVLRQAGNYANVSDYEADRMAGKHSFPPLPALFLVLDEFSELLSAKPEFIETFVAVGRLGRSMSIHLLLASQRLEEGRLRGLDSHLSYRVGLRTFSAQESRSVLGVPDAYELPSVPGVGYLKTGTEKMTRFRAAYVAAPPPARTGRAVSGPRGANAAPPRLLRFTAQLQREPEAEPIEQLEAPPVQAQLAGDERWADMSQIDIAVAKMRGKGYPAHQVWLPPLDEPDTLDVLLPGLAVDPELGLISQPARAAGRLRLVLGTVDVPLEQRRESLVFDLSGAGGHLAVVGGPMSGKSTALRTLVMALSLVNTPLEAQFYILDFGGGTFTPFQGAAHVAGVASRDRVEEVNRMVAEIEGIVADREMYFQQHRIDSMATYRQGRDEGRFDDGYGDVFLVVDGWGTLRSDFDDLEQRLLTLAGRALTFGVHFVLSAARWMELRQQIRDVISSRLELRLGDTSDSEIDRKIAALVPAKRPGRGIEARHLHVLVGLPRADGVSDASSLSAGVATLLGQISTAWTGTPGPKLRLLPTMVGVGEVQTMVPDSTELLLGVEESRLGPFTIDPAAESHLLLLGDAKSGKSSFLRLIAKEVMRLNTADAARFVVVDFRRALLGEIPDQYLTSYLTNKEEATNDLADLAAFLKTRLPDNTVTAEQLRNRSWWSGADVWVLVDDYDLVATSSGNPVAALQPLMAQAQDVGLHLVVVRRSGGASRAMYESVLQTMGELGATGILLSGNPEDGALIGRAKPIRSVPGRAQVVSRDKGHFAAQLAWVPPVL
jgi:DNA segregation ATPase FtsK/SpoIIIE, S-DNA-T family